MKRRLLPLLFLVLTLGSGFIQAASGEEEEDDGVQVDAIENLLEQLELSESNKVPMAELITTVLKDLDCSNDDPLAEQMLYEQLSGLNHDAVITVADYSTTLEKVRKVLAEPTGKSENHKKVLKAANAFSKELDPNLLAVLVTLHLFKKAS